MKSRKGSKIEQLMPQKISWILFLFDDIARKLAPLSQRFADSKYSNTWLRSRCVNLMKGS
ncbi:hypothetical protein DCC62_10750 [candidate division KSB1 bacterium]|nr:MAG: hypothetical protein DCC62_10750 [candidate division KSB1 bacterium]